jgi:hypothetical protein
LSEPSAVGRWFYIHEGRRHGPVELSRLVDLILAQELPEDCLIWRAGMPEWVRAHALEEIKRELPPPVPMSAAMPSPSPPEPHEDEEDGEDEESFEEEDVAEQEPHSSEPGAAVPGAPGSEVPPAPPSADESPAAARHHRHRHRHRRPMVARQTFLRRWLVPLVIVLLSLMIGLWWLLVRMNEVPSGRVIIREGALGRPIPPPRPAPRSGSVQGEAETRSTSS